MGRYLVIHKSSKNKMVGTYKENGSGRNAKKDDGRKTVHRQKKRKTSFEMDGVDEGQRAMETGC